MKYKEKAIVAYFNILLESSLSIRPFLPEGTRLLFLVDLTTLGYNVQKVLLCVLRWQVLQLKMSVVHDS